MTDPLHTAFADTVSPLLERTLQETIDDCPEGFAEDLAARLAAATFAPALVNLLRLHPELLDHLYPGAAEA